MKVLLIHPDLSFVNTGTGKVHAMDTRFTGLMCGRGVTSACSTHPSRQLDTEQLCGRCLASLRTYTSDRVRFVKESEVGA